MADQEATNGSNGGSFPEVRWQALALCRGLTPLFFTKGRSDIARYDQERAKGLCKHCDVRTQCFEAAFSREEPEYGVWGGLTEEERRDLDRSVRKALAALEVPSGSEDSSVLRRHLLSLFGAVFLDPEELSRILFGSTADAKVLNSLEKATTRLYTAYGTFSPGELLTSAQVHLRTVTGYLSHSQRLDHRSRLLIITGQLAAVAGSLSFEAHDKAALRDWYRMALQAGKEAGDNALCGFILGRQAYHAILLRKPVETLQLAEAAESMAGSSVSASRQAWFYSLQSRAHAELRNIGSCLRTQDLAHEAMSKAAPEERRPIPGLGHFDEAFLAVSKGHCLTLLGSPQAAEPLLRETLSQNDHPSVLRPTIIRLHLIEAYLGLGEVEEACRVASETITLPAEYRSATIAQQARRIHANLQQRKLTGSAVRELNEHLQLLVGPDQQ